MARAYCYRCHRAKAACICELAVAIDNPLDVYVLQHPGERCHARGSAIIAQLCLQNYHCWVGRDFASHRALHELVGRHPKTTMLVYPSQNARLLGPASRTDRSRWPRPDRLIFIDASWRKATKIWHSTPVLQSLPCIRLATDEPSRYRIRKIPRKGHLSTIESIACSLAWLDNDPQKYQPLLAIFNRMIERQIDKMGWHTYQRNYRNGNANETDEI